jgi:putative SOS response-associated peptidase YedK
LISQTAAFEVLADRFGIEVVDAETKVLVGRDKIAPSQLLPIVIAPDGRRRLLPARWGFRPPPSRYGKISPTHVRADVVVTRQVFRDTLRFTRCLVPADGFYEWTSVPGQRRKQPYFFRLKGGKLFAFAGLYTPPQPEEDIPATFAIITTIANEVAAPIHRRMPVLLDPSAEPRWLNPFFVTPTDVLRCLLPLPAERMEAYPASALVSSPHNEGSQLVELVSITPGEARYDDARLRDGK